MNTSPNYESNMVATQETMTRSPSSDPELKKLKLPEDDKRYLFPSFRRNLELYFSTRGYIEVLNSKRPELIKPPDATTSQEFLNLIQIERYNSELIKVCASALQALTILTEETQLKPMIIKHYPTKTDVLGRPDLAYKSIIDHYMTSAGVTARIQIRDKISSFTKDIQGMLNQHTPLASFNTIVNELEQFSVAAKDADVPFENEELIHILRKAMLNNEVIKFTAATEILPGENPTFDKYVKRLKTKIEDNYRDKKKLYDIQEQDTPKTEQTNYVNNKFYQGRGTGRGRNARDGRGGRGRGRGAQGGRNMNNQYHPYPERERPTCTKCKKTGHTAEDCLDHITCHGCGNKGHYFKDCRKSNPHLRNPQQYNTDPGRGRGRGRSKYANLVNSIAQLNSIVEELTKRNAVGQPVVNIVT